MWLHWVGDPFEKWKTKVGTRDLIGSARLLVQCKASRAESHPWEAEIQTAQLDSTLLSSCPCSWCCHNRHRVRRFNRRQWTVGHRSRSCQQLHQQPVGRRGSCKLEPGGCTVNGACLTLHRSCSGACHERTDVIVHSNWAACINGACCCKLCCPLHVFALANSVGVAAVPDPMFSCRHTPSSARWQQRTARPPLLCHP
jgi:hypothetical protein